MTTHRRLALQIRSRLALRDHTQKQRGEALGMGHAALSARMNGHRDFTLSELEKTADFLRVSLRDLLDFDADKEERP